ncbi:MAG: hypothetical protein R3E31_29995 [Chloroflexota bacterium]|nr:hypothetical protein [Anaerolineales bacterium]MCA9974715.1 hypothetical protein [Anaerolineales bacterium]
MKLRLPGKQVDVMRTNSQQVSTAATGTSAKQAVTPELVQQIADRVYRLWLQDVQIERERRRMETAVSRHQ